MNPFFPSTWLSSEHDTLVSMHNIQFFEWLNNEANLKGLRVTIYNVLSFLKERKERKITDNSVSMLNNG